MIELQFDHTLIENMTQTGCIVFEFVHELTGKHTDLITLPQPFQLGSEGIRANINVNL